MKTLKFISIGMMLFLSGVLKAQVSVNVNVGSPPPWGPVGYTEVRYYYLPDVEAYYDVQSSMFIYYGEGVWVRRAYLPVQYRSYDLYRGYKVVIKDYRGDAPYIHFKEYKIRYARGYRGEAQKTIGVRPVSGSSGAKIAREDNPGIKEAGKSAAKVNDKSNAPGNDKNNKKEQGNGKKK